MKRFYKLLGIIVIGAAIMAFAGCEVLAQVASGCANSGACMYDPNTKESETCKQTGCSIYQAAQSGSISFGARCNCGK
jgi:hypothetical protein